MSTAWIALFRGINVGRNKRIAMGDMRAMLESLGYGEVRTLLQSGNALFETGTRKPETLEAEISAGIKATFGMEVATLVRSAPEFVKAVDANPFVTRGIDTVQLHATFLSAAPGREDRRRRSRRLRARRVRRRRAGDLHATDERRDGSRLPDWDRVLGVRATTRNWNTTIRLREMAG